MLRVAFIASVIIGSYYQYRSNVIKESIDGLVKLNSDLEHRSGFFKGIAVFILKLIPNFLVAKLGYYLFTIDVLLMIGSLLLSQKLLTIFGIRFLA